LQLQLLLVLLLLQLRLLLLHLVLLVLLLLLLLLLLVLHMKLMLLLAQVTLVLDAHKEGLESDEFGIVMGHALFLHLLKFLQHVSKRIVMDIQAVKQSNQKGTGEQGWTVGVLTV
jgi:hypothetical protein